MSRAADLDQAREGAAEAYNQVSSAAEVLAVLDMALAYHDNAVAPFSQFATVLRHVMDLVSAARDGAGQACNALGRVKT